MRTAEIQKSNTGLVLLVGRWLTHSSKRWFKTPAHLRNLISPVDCGLVISTSQEFNGFPDVNELQKREFSFDILFNKED
jgi:hypothetical protein